MGFDKSSVMFGLGIGVIVAALLVFAGVWINAGLDKEPSDPAEPEAPVVMSDEQIVAEARDLGMMFMSEAVESIQPPTEQEIIDSARALGMMFAEELNPEADASVQQQEEGIQEPSEVTGDALVTPKPEPTPTPVPTAEPTPEPTVEPPPAPTETIEPTAAPSVTPKPVATPKPPADQSTPAPAQTQAPGPVPTATPRPTSSASAASGIAAVKISDGQTPAQIAEALRISGVISDAADFASHLESNLSGQTIAGRIYLLPVGGDYDRILDVLLDR